MTTSDGPIRLDAKLAGVTRNGRTAMVCFYVRGQEADLDALVATTSADLILGVIATREVITPNGADSEA
jgi:hypothetical protein